MPAKIFLIIFFLSISVAAYSQVIPSSKRVDWTQVGLESKMDTPSLILNVMDFGVAADAATDDFPAIDSAIQSLNGSPGIIYFPSGIYLVKSTLVLPDSIILAGFSSDSTTLLFDLPSSGMNCINMGRGQRGSFVSVTGGAFRGSSSISVSGSSGFSAGDWVEIRQQNGSWDVQPASGVDYCVGQVVKLAAVNGNQFTLDQALRISYNASLNPELRKLNPARQIGIENLKVERKTDPGSGAGRNFSYTYAVNCWLSGIESKKSIGAHVLLNISSHISITGSYFHEAFTYDGSGTRGYGICLIQHSGDVLVEDNIFRKLRHAMVVKQGANGNVFGYNYSLEPTRSEFQSDYGGDISAHGHFPFANLFEGNIVQNIHLDYAWGPAGPLNTFFRNRAELFGIWMTSGSYPSDSQNFVGNEVTHVEQCLYFCLLKKGNYSLAGSGHFEYGNLIKGTSSQGIITPPNTGTLADKSYYLSGTPAFWNVADTFPSIGPGNLLDSGSTPAFDRYHFASAKTISNDVLPVELTTFRVIPGKTTVVIEWSTASENNNDYFVVERSADLHSIDDVVKVDGAGDSWIPLSYKATDEQPLQGVSYYRLRQIDFNGEINFHKWVAVRIEMNQPVKAYPQPVAGQQLWLELPGEMRLPVSIYITDAAGRQVLREQQDEYKAAHLLPSGLKGIYTLTVIDAGQQVERLNISVL
ncbi:MAG: glycosyl hydrolase family 28-related protein [Bacteroidia bacterium]